MGYALRTWDLGQSPDDIITRCHQTLVFALQAAGRIGASPALEDWQDLHDGTLLYYNGTTLFTIRPLD